MPTIPPQHLEGFFPFVLSGFTSHIVDRLAWPSGYQRVCLHRGSPVRISALRKSVGTVHRTPSRPDRRRVSHPPMVRVSRVLPFCLRYPARHGQHFYGATTKYYPPVHPALGHGRSCTPGSAVLYCRVYSATAFKHSLVGFPPRAPLLRVVELLPLPLRAGGFHRACWADVLRASTKSHSIYWIVSHAPATIPPPFAGLPDVSSPLPRLCWPGLVPMYSPQCAAYIEDVGRRALPLA